MPDLSNQRFHFKYSLTDIPVLPWFFICCSLSLFLCFAFYETPGTTQYTKTEMNYTGHKE